MDNLVSHEVLLAADGSGTIRRRMFCVTMFEALVRIDLSGCVVMEFQQVLQRGWNWIYVLTPVHSAVRHRERRGGDWAVCYWKLADSHRRCGSTGWLLWWLFLFCLCSFSQWNCYASRPLIKPSLAIRSRLQIAQQVYCTSPRLPLLLLIPRSF